MQLSTRPSRAPPKHPLAILARTGRWFRAERAAGPGSARPTRPSGARPLPSLALRPGDACRVPNSAHALAWLQVSLRTYIHQVVVRIGTGFEPVGLTCGFDRVSKPCTPRLVPAGAGVFASSIRKGPHLNEVPALVHRRTKVLFGLLWLSPVLPAQDTGRLVRIPMFLIPEESCLKGT